MLIYCTASHNMIFTVYGAYVLKVVSTFSLGCSARCGVESNGLLIGPLIVWVWVWRSKVAFYPSRWWYARNTARAAVSAFLTWQWQTERPGWAAWPSESKGQRGQPAVSLSKKTQMRFLTSFPISPVWSSPSPPPHFSTDKKMQPHRSDTHNNDDAGSLGSDNPCLRVPRSPPCPFGNRWEIKFREHIMFREKVYHFNAGPEVLNI